MTNDANNLTEISIDNLFNENVQYVIPIYQRNYAWSDAERAQLLEDMLDVVNTEKEYFLGSLVVYERDDAVYEVIDGQQRLTTLFILLAVFNKYVTAHSLRFEARDKSNNTLEKIVKNITIEDESFYSIDLLNAWEQFQQLMPDIERLLPKINQIKLLRIVVPEDTDLNYYFEIMNTRGEQLEAHEILKARLMSRISGENVHIKRNVFSTIWDACAHMNEYVQMSFKTNDRRKVFGKQFAELKVNSFDDIVQKITLEKQSDVKASLPTMSIVNAIETYNKIEYDLDYDEVDNNDNRFESIITFPTFLLHVLKIYKANGYQDEDHTLNDNNLLNLFDDQVDPESFIYLLLKCRFLFDKFIIKREHDYNKQDESTWSLQELKSYERSIDYVQTNLINHSDSVYKKIRTLQSVLRITYTSPKTMHWITHALTFLKNNVNNKQFAEDYLSILENYARNKVNEGQSQLEDGIRMERIVFSYLDYLLWRDGYQEIIDQMEDYEFTFRNSIEHFYPQNPNESEGDERIKPSILNHFGNLCLITVSANSKFSNQNPNAKTTNKKTVASSQKLRIMASMTTNSVDGWTEHLIMKHGEEMFRIIKNELDKKQLTN